MGEKKLEGNYVNGNIDWGWGFYFYFPYSDFQHCFLDHSQSESSKYHAERFYVRSSSSVHSRTYRINNASVLDL